MHPFTQVLAVLGALLILMSVKPCEAQDVNYCKHAQTGGVIVIQAGYACPAGYYKI